MQKRWTVPLFEGGLRLLLDSCSSPKDLARLLGAATRWSGEFLDAVPIAAVGTKLDDKSFCVASALRPGVPLSLQLNCGAISDASGTHGLDCPKTLSRHNCHSALNALIRMALAAAGVPSRLEPVGLSRYNGKRPDGASLVPWRKGRLHVWDFTCPNTLAASHLSIAVSGACEVARIAEDRKRTKYSCIDQMQHTFVLFAIESMGAVGPTTEKFFAELGKMLAAVTNDRRAASHLSQRLSCALHKGNAACILEATFDKHLAPYEI